jgi:ATP-dependent helicase HepA
VHVEELGSRSYLLLPGHLITDAFPALPPEGLSVTFDRTRAASREDLGFMSWDHPIVRGALDLLLGGEFGNAAFGIWRGAGEGLLLEIHAVVEAVAPAALHIDRFLPAVRCGWWSITASPTVATMRRCSMRSWRRAMSSVGSIGAR